jgi:TolB-like protein/Tfp pilus assembly protein PilF
LRKTLSENGERFIETVPKRGYRFVAPVREQVAESVMSDESTAAKDGQSSESSTWKLSRWLRRRSGLTALLLILLLAGLAGAFGYQRRARQAKPAASNAAIRSIAVLPFKPLVVGSRDEAMELGMADTLITRLSNLRQITVKPMSAVRRYMALDQDPVAAGREQRVDAVLEGSLHPLGEKIRVTARLVDVRDGKSLGGFQCEEYCTDIFAAQDAISQKMIEALSPALTGEEKKLLAKRYTENVAAFQAYQTGRIHVIKRTPEEVLLGIKYYQKAIDLDPNYAQAYAALSFAYSFLGRRGGLAPAAAYPKAQAAATKALELDDTLAESHFAQANVKWGIDFDWVVAERELKRAIDLDPNSAEMRHNYSHFLASLRRSDESLAQGRRAMEIDPLDLVVNAHLGWHYLFMRQYDQAIAECRRALEKGDALYPRYWLGLALEQKGRHEEAIAEFNKAIAMSETNTELRVALGHVYAVSGQRAAAQKVIDDLNEAAKHRYVSLSQQAFIYAGLGDHESAFKWMRQAFNERSGWVVEMTYDPRLDPLRPDPRFKQMERRLLGKSNSSF